MLGDFLSASSPVLTGLCQSHSDNTQAYSHMLDRLPPPISERPSIHACASTQQTGHYGMGDAQSESRHTRVRFKKSIDWCFTGTFPKSSEENCHPFQDKGRCFPAACKRDPTKGRTNAVLNCPLSANIDNVSPVAAIDRLLDKHAAEPGQRWKTYHSTDGVTIKCTCP